ncbi:sigma-70 family RNA polymerase sigma factor [Nitrospirillum viridazoti]|nr:sigma-70 family RNA polymerase sigma factor [Nitrospirillum amazonense]
MPSDLLSTDLPAGALNMDKREPEFRDEVLRLLPALRAFARSLTSNAADTDDLVQDCVVRAWSHADQFTPGTNLRAWLFTILRNRHYSIAKRRQREVADPDGFHTGRMMMEPAQEWGITGRELKVALAALPEDQREALILVGGAGVSYEEAAEICGCALGTIKSRVNRARTKLAGLMGLPNRVVALSATTLPAGADATSTTQWTRH